MYLGLPFGVGRPKYIVSFAMVGLILGGDFTVFSNQSLGKDYAIVKLLAYTWY